MESIKLGLSKLLSLRPRDWADLLVAQAALLRAQLLVRTRPRGSLIAPVPGPNGRAAGNGNGALDPVVDRVATAVSRVARYGVFRPNCLVRAVALQDLLRRRGLGDSSLRIGVRQENGQFFAHAWVDYDGRVLADEEWHVKRFDELARLGISVGSMS